MGQTLSVSPGIARNPVAENRIEQPKPAIQIATVATSCKWFIGLAKKLSSNKPAAAIHHLTGEPERTCYEWVRGKFDPPSRAIIKLLHTDAGWIVLEYLMRGCKAPWWIEVRQARECAGAYEARKREIQGELNLT